MRSAARRTAILLGLAAAELAPPGALNASAAPAYATSSRLHTTGIQPDTAALSAFIASFIERAQIPAAAVSVATADGVIYARGFGRSRGEPVGPDSRFYLGSTTKTLTALGILVLVADGALSLDDAVADLVPGFRLADPAATSALTVRHLLTHASDLGRYLAALLRATDGDTARSPIPPELRAELFRPWRGEETGVGLSWGITRWNGLRAYTHSGMTSGFYSVLVLLPDAGYGIAVLFARNAGPFFAAPADLADGIIRRLAGQELVTYGNRERWVRWGFLALFVLTIAQAGRHLRRWWRLGRPMTLRPTPRVLALLGLDLALSVGVVVWILRGVAKIPLSAMLEFYPDLGALLVAAVVIGVPDAAIQAFSRSKEAARTSRLASGPAETYGAPGTYAGSARADEDDHGPA